MGFTPLRAAASTRRDRILFLLGVVLTSALLAWAVVTLRRSLSDG